MLSNIPILRIIWDLVPSSEHMRDYELRSYEIPVLSIIGKSLILTIWVLQKLGKIKEPEWFVAFGGQAPEFSGPLKDRFVHLDQMVDQVAWRVESADIRKVMDS